MPHSQSSRRKRPKPSSKRTELLEQLAAHRHVATEHVHEGRSRHLALGVGSGPPTRSEAACAARVWPDRARRRVADQQSAFLSPRGRLALAEVTLGRGWSSGTRSSSRNSSRAPPSRLCAPALRAACCAAAAGRRRGAAAGRAGKAIDAAHAVGGNRPPGPPRTGGGRAIRAGKGGRGSDSTTFARPLWVITMTDGTFGAARTRVARPRAQYTGEACGLSGAAGEPARAGATPGALSPPQVRAGPPVRRAGSSKSTRTSVGARTSGQPSSITACTYWRAQPRPDLQGAELALLGEQLGGHPPISPTP